MKRIIAIVGCFLLLGGSSMAQTKPIVKKPVMARAVPLPKARPVVQDPAKVTLQAAQQNPLLALQTFTVGDLQNALADAQAQNPPDQVAAQCYTALIPLIQTGVANPLPSGLGGFQLLQKLRDAKAAIASIQSPTGPLQSLNIACAPLVLDSEKTLLQLGIVGGGIAASGGLTLPFSLGGIFPFLKL